MNNLERRIERLEERLGMKPGLREILITNVNFSDGDESPCEVEFLNLEKNIEGARPWVDLNSG